jgi:hypothetical protein
MLQGLIEGIHQQQQPAHRRGDPRQGRHHRLVPGGTGILVGLVEAAPQALGVVGLDRGAIGRQRRRQLGGHAGHKLPRRQGGVADVVAEVVGRDRQAGAEVHGGVVDQFGQEGGFAHAVVGRDQQGLLRAAAGPGAHLLKQPAAPHEPLAFVGPMGGGIDWGGPAPTQVFRHRGGLLCVGHQHGGGVDVAGGDAAEHLVLVALNPDRGRGLWPGVIRVWGELHRCLDGQRIGLAPG